MADLARRANPSCQVGLLIADSQDEYDCARGCGVTAILSATLPSAYVGHVLRILVARGLGLTAAAGVSALDEALLKLTPREIEVWRLLALGRTVDEAADELAINPATAANHKTHVMAKLKVHRRADLARTAVEVGLVSADEHNE